MHDFVLSYHDIEWHQTIYSHEERHYFLVRNRNLEKIYSNRLEYLLN